jgi:hypothetical protein
MAAALEEAAMPTYTRSLSLPLLLVPLALFFGVWLGGAPAQGQSASPKWEYRTEAWTIDDMTAVLRTLTGDELASLDDMAHSLARGTELVDDARVQEEVQRRMQERMAKLGAEGWEVFWISDSRAVIGGVLLPAPRVTAKRRAP